MPIGLGINLESLFDCGYTQEDVVRTRICFTRAVRVGLVDELVSCWGVAGRRISTPKHLYSIPDGIETELEKSKTIRVSENMKDRGLTEYWSQGVLSKQFKNNK